MGEITILIVDDHNLIRETWTFVLNNDPRFKVIAQAASGEEAVEAVKNFHPHVIIMDITLPGMDGIETTEHICKEFPGTKIIGMSAHSKTNYARQIIEKGALGYVTKNSSRDEMYKAVIEVNAGNKFICVETRKLLAEQFRNVNFENTEGPLTQHDIELIAYLKKEAS